MTYGDLDSDDRVDIGRLATWSVSSAKTGHGLEMLRDNNLDTYWQ
jgi:anaphase-promoting complex subunit 10